MPLVIPFFITGIPPFPISTGTNREHPAFIFYTLFLSLYKRWKNHGKIRSSLAGAATATAAAGTTAASRFLSTGNIGAECRKNFIRKITTCRAPGFFPG